MAIKHVRRPVVAAAFFGTPSGGFWPGTGTKRLPLGKCCVKNADFSMKKRAGNLDKRLVQSIN